MSKVLHFSDESNGRPGRGATIRLDSGEPCLISIAQTGVRVKKSRFGFLGATLYNEKNVYKAAVTATALSERFPTSLLPQGFSDPVLRAFANAVLHCSTAAEVSIILNDATPTATVMPTRPTPGGATPDTAIRIHAADSLEGIPKEHAVLTAMFGTPKQDWKLTGRSLIKLADGRKLEKFIVSVLDERREVYFDITEWFGKNTAQETKAALNHLIYANDRQVEIAIPKEEFMTLQVGLLKLTAAQLDQLGLSSADRQTMLNPLLDALKRWHGLSYADVPDHLRVTALMSVWSKTMGLLVSWEPSDLLQEEELENLKAIIGGTMDATRKFGD